MDHQYIQKKLPHKKRFQDPKRKSILQNQNGDVLFDIPLILTFFFILLTSFIKINQNLTKQEVKSIQHFKHKWDRLEKEYEQNR